MGAVHISVSRTAGTAGRPAIRPPSVPRSATQRVRHLFQAGQCLPQRDQQLVKKIPAPERRRKPAGRRSEQRDFFHRVRRRRTLPLICRPVHPLPAGPATHHRASNADPQASQKACSSCNRHWRIPVAAIRHASSKALKIQSRHVTCPSASKAMISSTCCRNSPRRSSSTRCSGTIA